ncbi:hypothetical protein CcaverHIS002_0312150 [Cutaneotrichosporon cavernicola]|nr:hypothetical protein CcaverHIS002_0312150 [Cutaneotrichosporon cavernicola]
MRLLLPALLGVASATAESARQGFGAVASRHSPPSTELADLRGIGVSPVQSHWATNMSLVPPGRRPGNPPKDDCPPCFNCLLPAFNCGQFGECNQFDGLCRCPAGFGGQDCLTPLCGSLADGDERFPRPDKELCKCNDGWGGINCNLCKDDRACKGFKMRDPLTGLHDPSSEHADDGDNHDDDEMRMTCYKGGITVDRGFQMCDVTNRKIIDTIPNNRPPQVTFSCTAGGPQSNSSLNNGRYGLVGDDTILPYEEKGTCGFQFWVDRIESFYCKLEQCDWIAEEGYDGSNETHYRCDKVECACIPGRFLCGEDGSVNIDDFLAEEIKGPGSFNCISGKGCTFEEPAMNQLINDIFGDRSITLDCESGECVHYTQVPGYNPPHQPDNSVLVALSAALAATIFVLACVCEFYAQFHAHSEVMWYAGRTQRLPGGTSGIKLPEEEAAKLMSDHVPATLHFSNVSYTLPTGRELLSHVTGTTRPGEIMAIMGASGAGKSTLLDILGRRAKTGTVTGEVYVNGRILESSTFRRVAGFVDQEDTLLPTLTVYETVLYSALLRLPREMSYEAKVYRTLETMEELGILGIKDSRIGESGKRSISGGEKRRVSIACELVTGPSILFLDEPTSGLDSYNAFNVVESLKTLAKEYNRTVIFTIHQPQSNIVALFDRLLLLGRGQMVYSGDASKAQAHFEAIGHPCPPGFNIADFLIDLTVEAAGDHRKSVSASAFASGMVSGIASGTDTPARPNASAPRNGPSDAEAGFSSHSRRDPLLAFEEENPVETVAVGIKKKAARVLGLFSSGTPTPPDANYAVPEQLATLVLACRASDGAKITEAEIMRIEAGESADGVPNDQRDVSEEIALLRGYDKATFWTQFRLLSGRAFKNLYRNPMLMFAHYAVAVVVALLCGFFFYHVTNDIPGFQNRLGLFLFILSLFGFSTLSSLGIFANERMLFMRERANGYYKPGAYFLSKVLFDILPLRVIPPFVLGSIVYGLAGLNPEVSSFWKFIMTLVLFNLAASSIVLFISVSVADQGVANLLGSLVMLYNLLFAGLLMNYDRVAEGLRWMLTLSFFHAAYEALLVNELRYLQLVEHKFGLDIQVPSATILSSFGFHAQAFWWPDTALLCIVFGVFTVASYLLAANGATGQHTDSVALYELEPYVFGYAAGLEAARRFAATGWYVTRLDWERSSHAAAVAQPADSLRQELSEGRSSDAEEQHSVDYDDADDAESVDIPFLVPHFDAVIDQRAGDEIAENGEFTVAVSDVDDEGEDEEGDAAMVAEVLFADTSADMTESPDFDAVIDQRAGDEIAENGEFTVAVSDVDDEGEDEEGDAAMVAEVLFADTSADMTESPDGEVVKPEQALAQEDSDEVGPEIVAFAVAEAAASPSSVGSPAFAAGPEVKAVPKAKRSASEMSKTSNKEMALPTKKRRPLSAE